MRIVLNPCKYGLILLLAASLFSCNGSSGRYIIGPKKFVNVLVDVHLADGIANYNINHANPFMVDSANLYGSVFKKNGVTRAQFDSTLNYYSRHPDDFQKLYNKVTARLKRIEDDLNAEAKAREALKKDKPEEKVK